MCCRVVVTPAARSQTLQMWIVFLFLFLCASRRESPQMFPPLCKRDSVNSGFCPVTKRLFDRDWCQHTAGLCRNQPRVSATPKLNLPEFEIFACQKRTAPPAPRINDVIVEAAWGRWWRRGPETERAEQTRTHQAEALWRSRV